MVTQSEATKLHLSQHAVSQAQALLTTLTSRTKTSTNTLDIFQPSTSTHETVPAYFAGTHLRSYTLPPLPEVSDNDLRTAPFTHKSVSGTDRVIAKQSSNHDYERLEFLGDAYLETIATRLIFSRYSHMALGRQAQIRERLVKNETLCGFSKAYDFEARLLVTDNERKSNLAAGNKGLKKILADVFEAYVAAVILSDPVNGFLKTEQWLTELWAPILLNEFGPESKHALQADYDPEAKAVLQARVGVGASKEDRTVIEYVPEQPMVQSKHGQTFFIKALLTGHGYEKEYLGSGKGSSKTEAGNRAAMHASIHSAETIAIAEKSCLAKKAERARIKEEEATKGNDQSNQHSI